jgi:hypothetical protein
MTLRLILAASIFLVFATVAEPQKKPVHKPPVPPET